MAAMLRRICFRSPPRHLPGRLLRPLASVSPSNPSDQNHQKSSAGDGSLAEMAMSHPWPEWVELMERLLQKNYLTSACKDINHIRTACLNFARDRPHLFQYLSLEDILVIVRNGCPSVDRKVVNSAKRLRAFLGIEEANVCKSCDLRGRCERAYAKSHEKDGGTTADVMRILLTFGLDAMTGSAESKLCLKEKVKLSARKLLNSILEERDTKNQEVVPEGVSPLSQVPCSKPITRAETNHQSKNGDWVCSKCKFLNFSRNIRCLRCNEISLEKLKKLRSEREHLPLKKGDWICDTCDFLNFAKNSICLQCNEKPTNRQLNPGEWECTSELTNKVFEPSRTNLIYRIPIQDFLSRCGFVNFRRNETCLRCGWKRPKAGHNVSETGHSQLLQRKAHERQTHEVATFWSSEEDGSEDDLDDDHDVDVSVGFEDFPVVGGRSTISRDPLETRKWREAKKGRPRGKSGVEQFRIPSCANNSAFAGPCDYKSGEDDDDDDEMRGWFQSRADRSR